MSVCFLYKSDDSSLSARKMWRGWTFSNWQMCFKFYCPCSLQDPSIMQKQNDLWWHVICAESTHPDGRQFWSLKHALRMAVDRCDGRMHWCWMWQEENSICSSSAAIIIGDGRRRLWKGAKKGHTQGFFSNLHWGRLWAVTGLNTCITEPWGALWPDHGLNMCSSRVLLPTPKHKAAPN